MAGRLHCRSLGTGPDLVMLHGWALHSGIWAPIEEALAARFRLHLLDLPGHGASAGEEAFTLEAACLALAEQAPPRAHWLGWSLGGMLALEFAARFPERVSRLVLLATNPRFVADAAWPEAIAREVLEAFTRGLETEFSATLNRFLGLVARGAPDSGLLRQLRRAMAVAPPPTPEALQGGLDILRESDLRLRLDEVSAPVLLLGGGRDTLVPIDALRRVQREHPQFRLREVPEAGHAPFISHADACVAAITEFLR